MKAQSRFIQRLHEHPYKPYKRPRVFRSAPKGAEHGQSLKEKGRRLINDAKLVAGFKSVCMGLHHQGLSAEQIKIQATTEYTLACEQVDLQLTAKVFGLRKNYESGSISEKDYNFRLAKVEAQQIRKLWHLARIAGYTRHVRLYEFYLARYLAKRDVGPMPFYKVGDEISEEHLQAYEDCFDLMKKVPDLVLASDPAIRDMIILGMHYFNKSDFQNASRVFSLMWSQPHQQVLGYLKDSLNQYNIDSVTKSFVSMIEARYKIEAQKQGPEVEEHHSMQLLIDAWVWQSALAIIMTKARQLSWSEQDSNVIDAIQKISLLYIMAYRGLILRSPKAPPLRFLQHFQALDNNPLRYKVLLACIPFILEKVSQITNESNKKNFLSLALKLNNELNEHFGEVYRNAFSGAKLPEELTFAVASLQILHQIIQVKLYFIQIHMLSLPDQGYVMMPLMNEVEGLLQRAADIKKKHSSLEQWLDFEPLAAKKDALLTSIIS